MTVEDTVRKMVMWCPSISPDRLAVLNQLFCVVGNGYEWEKGELVEINPMSYKEYLKDRAEFRDRREKELAFKPREIQKIYKDYWKKVEKNEKKIRSQVDKICTPWKFIVYEDTTFYPLDNYSKIFNLPEDIKMDWLEAAHEITEAILLCNPYYLCHGRSYRWNMHCIKQLRRYMESKKCKTL